MRMIYSYPGNIGNWGLQHFPESWKYWKSQFFYILDAWKCWKFHFSGVTVPGSWKYWKSKSATFSRILEIFGIQVSIIPRILEILGINIFLYFRTPGNIGKSIFLSGLLVSWKYWKLDFWCFLISWKCWKYDFCWFFGFFPKKDARRNFTQDAPTDEPRSLIWDRFRPEN